MDHGPTLPFPFRCRTPDPGQLGPPKAAIPPLIDLALGHSNIHICTLYATSDRSIRVEPRHPEEGTIASQRKAKCFSRCAVRLIELCFEAATLPMQGA